MSFSPSASGSGDYCFWTSALCLRNLGPHRVIDQTLDQRGKLLAVERLGHVVVAPGIDRAAQIIAGRARGKRDDGKGFPTTLGANLPGERHAVFATFELEVHQDQAQAL